MGFEEHRFVGQVRSELKCSLCHGVLDNPMRAPACGKVFCAGCLLPTVLKDGKCPMRKCCRLGAFSVPDLSHVPELHNTVLNMEIRCDFIKRGCQDTMLFSDLPKHLQECKFRIAGCRNRGCFLTMEYRDLPRHERENCEFRPVGICQKGCSLVVALCEANNHDCVDSLRRIIAMQEVKLSSFEGDLRKMVIREKSKDKAHMIQLNNLHNEIQCQAHKFQDKISYYQHQIELLMNKIKNEEDQVGRF